MKKCNCSRREFIVKGSKVVAGLGVATFFVKPGKAWSEESKEEPQLLTLNLEEKDNAKLKEVGGTIFVVSPVNKKEKIIVYRESKESVKAFRNFCTHKGGPLKAPNKDGVMVCEWHRAKFDLSGKVKKGPAKKDLEIYDAIIEEGIIKITL